MTPSQRPQAPEIDFEFNYEQVGSHYDFQSVWNEKEQRWFVEAVRIKGLDGE